MERTSFCNFAYWLRNQYPLHSSNTSYQFSIDDDAIDSYRSALDSYTQSYPKSFDDVDIVYANTLNRDADIATPVMSTGWRSSDIDTLQTTTDPRLANVLNARLVSDSQMNTDTSGLTDAQIAEMAVPRNLNLSDLDSLSSQIEGYQQAIADNKLTPPADGVLVTDADAAPLGPSH